ncbi:ABC-type sugar transport system ATPase subunit [Thermosulfuriphilus ammonigenes]|uniref:ATP-binding cassette domain-containing protein n=1 Tax=Thermosulfuriphilus ammonigenes TaxID=1936021 RepID=UPI0017A37A5C|nr:ABC transporter ATP-binding protein [Thermosulfuriphilus ammonigenes]MBA2847711.1 ABC-type sugar transport system ATPase subunit [Thermosulfuriphilus ammonigenes]
MASVRLEGVSKIYPRQVRALVEVDLLVPERSFLTILGPSGCGKTTLLRVIAGLEQVSSGKIHIDSRLVNELPPARRDVAMVFQNYALYPHFRVYKNIAFGLKMRGLPREERFTVGSSGWPSFWACLGFLSAFPGSFRGENNSG